MKIELLPDAESTARAAAKFIVAEANAAIVVRGQFVMAVSGGHSPWIMLRALAKEDLAWERIHVLQADERAAPDGDPDRNLTHLRESLLGISPVDQSKIHAPQTPQIDARRIHAKQIHAMVVQSTDLEAAARQYASVLSTLTGSPPTLDLIHLGLGPDGHTASLVPGDPVLNVTDRDVAVTGSYQGRRRVTLTYPVINRARRVLWLVTGSEKAGMLARLRKGDISIPAGRVCQDRAVIFADRAATGDPAG
jgi:6-phosphogluconolactonase